MSKRIFLVTLSLVLLLSAPALLADTPSAEVQVESGEVTQEATQPTKLTAAIVPTG